jgi:hypothetical protein
MERSRCHVPKHAAAGGHLRGRFVAGAVASSAALPAPRLPGPATAGASAAAGAAAGSPGVIGGLQAAQAYMWRGASSISKDLSES